MEEFEFKPLTDGLGFHDKTGGRPRGEETQASLRIDTPKFMEPKPEITRPLAKAPAPQAEESARPVSKAISDMIASLPPSLDFIEDRRESKSTATSVEKPVEKKVPEIFQPFAREDFKAGASGPTVGSALGGKLMPAPMVPASSPYRERLDESFARAFPHAADRRIETKAESRIKTQIRPEMGETGVLEPIAAHFGAGFLDAMIVTGVGMILLVAIILITHINLWGLLSNAQTDRPTQIHIVLLFISVMQLYLLTARSFFGASLGEWAFDLELGKPEDRWATVYPLRVAWRTLVVTVTGIVVLPLISHLVGRDLAAKASGLQLYRRT